VAGDSRYVGKNLFGCGNNLCATQLGTSQAF
jgi:hypothetical protein